MGGEGLWESVKGQLQGPNVTNGVRDKAFIGLRLPFFSCISPGLEQHRKWEGVVSFFGIVAPGWSRSSMLGWALNLVTHGVMLWFCMPHYTVHAAMYSTV